MSEVLDLSTLRGRNNPEEGPSLDNLSEEEQKRLEEMAALAEEVEPTNPVATAFLVVIDQEGNAFAHPDLDFKVTRDRMPTGDDIYGACHVVAKDVSIQESARMTVTFMQQFAQAQAQAIQNQQIANGLHLPKR